MKRHAVPSVGRVLVALVLAAGLVPDDAQHDMVEYFAGRKALSKGFVARGYKCVSYELRDDPCLEDILGDDGFIHALVLLLCIRPAGLAWWGIVCSTWVWMCRASTQPRPVRPAPPA